MSMTAGEKVSPQTTVAIILGANNFTRSPILESNPAFARSAEDFKQYLLDPKGFALPSVNLMDLFDSQKASSEILEEISSFLTLRQRELENEVGARDLIVYYTGHGSFTSTGEYFLAIALTRQGMEGATSLRMSDLATAIKTKARGLRRFLILDCCFSASAFKEFQSTPLVAARTQTLNSFPKEGTTLLCSSSAKKVSITPKGAQYTMFSGALIHVLRQGAPNIKDSLSMEQLGAQIKERIKDLYRDEAVRPEVLSPNQQAEDIALVPIFPNSARKPKSISAEVISLAGIKVLPSETEVHDWDKLFSKAQSIDLMGHGLHELFENHIDIVKSAVNRGCKIRVLLLDPDGALTREAGNQLDPGYELQQKIRTTIRKAREIQVVVRITNRTMYAKICRFDDFMYVTPYTSINEPGKNNPCFALQKENMLFWHYLKEFDRMWRKHKKEYRGIHEISVVPSVDTVMNRYNDWKNLHRIITNSVNATINEELLPHPQMAVIYPTYICRLGCKYCTTGRLLESKTSMSTNLFSKILSCVKAADVPLVELSGGGEPLDHPKIIDILNVVEQKHKEYNNKIEFGLLSNGIWRNNNISEILKNNFRYVRLTFCEEIAENINYRKLFLQNVSYLCQQPKEDNLSVGIKLVITQNLVKLQKEKKFISEMLKEFSGININYLRIKLARAEGEQTPTPEQVESIWPELYESMETSLPNVDISADLDILKVRDNYKCWFGASVVVIEPNGHGHPCVNYHNIKNRLSAINFNHPDLSENDTSWWRSHQVRQALNRFTAEACNHICSIDCRFARYQQQLEQIILEEQYFIEKTTKKDSVLQKFF